MDHWLHNIKVYYMAKSVVFLMSFGLWCVVLLLLFCVVVCLGMFVCFLI